MFTRSLRLGALATVRGTGCCERAVQETRTARLAWRGASVRSWRMGPYHEVSVLHDGRVVRLQRTTRGFETADDLRFERCRLVEQLNSLGRQGRGLLIDSRSAPHSTESHLDEEFRRYRREVMSGFDRVAALVRTKVAILQVNRLCAGQASAFQVFNDESDAVTYLLGADPSSPSSR